MPLNATPGSPTADALITREWFLDWASKNGFADLVGTTEGGAGLDPETDVDPAIRRASTFMSLAFGWKGAKANGRGQAQAWPRINVLDDLGMILAEMDEIPLPVMIATAHATVQELRAPFSLMPVVETTPAVKRKRVGSLEVEYFAPPSEIRPTITAVAPLIAEYLVADRGSGLVGYSYRV